MHPNHGKTESYYLYSKARHIGDLLRALGLNRLLKNKSTSSEQHGTNSPRNNLNAEYELERRWALEQYKMGQRAWTECDPPSVLKLIHSTSVATYILAPIPLPKIITVGWISPVHARIAEAAGITPSGGVPMKFHRIAYNVYAKLATQPTDESDELFTLHPIEGDQQCSNNSEKL